MWRHHTMGSWSLVLNAAANWNKLVVEEMPEAKKPEEPKPEEKKPEEKKPDEPKPPSGDPTRA
jgi:hypothetical protein